MRNRILIIATGGELVIEYEKNNFYWTERR